MLPGGVNGFLRFLTSHSGASRGWPLSFLLPTRASAFLPVRQVELGQGRNKGCLSPQQKH